MADSMFDIFGRHIHETENNVARFGHPKFGVENISKKAFAGGHLKPTEAIKKTDSVKKSFLCNKGTAIQATPVKPFGIAKNTPLNSNKQQLKIYSDEPQFKHTAGNYEDASRTEKNRKANFSCDNFTRDLFDQDPYFDIRDEGFQVMNSPPCRVENAHFEMIGREAVKEDYIRYADDSFDDYVNTLDMPILSDDSF